MTAMHHHAMLLASCTVTGAAELVRKVMGSNVAALYHEHVLVKVSNPHWSSSRMWLPAWLAHWGAMK